MVELSFSYYDLEYFLLIFVRVSCFVFIAPFFSMGNTPARVKIVFSAFLSILLYGTLSPAAAVMYDSEFEYAILVGKEALAGLLLGFASTMCSSIINFAGSIIDMEIGLSMVTMFDPTTKENSSISGVFYQYAVMMMMIASGMYRYLIGALADSFLLIPVGGMVYNSEHMLNTVIAFLGEYIVIGFRICLPVFSVALLLNAVLGILAKVASQMNMFAVGIQLKIVVGLGILAFTAVLLPDVAGFIFSEMKTMTEAFVGGMR